MLRSLAFDRRVCVAANRWGARRAVGVFFGAISRLGDGLFWYALMLALVALVAASRVILGLHYPSDVLAAVGIGGALGALSLWLPHAVAALA